MRSHFRGHARLAPLVAVAALALSAAVIPSSAAAGPSDSGCDNRNLRTTSQLLSCVNADDAVQHLEAFQAIADANGGTRSSGTPGYDASVDYVVEVLEEAGLDVSTQDFEFVYSEDNTEVERIDPDPVLYPGFPDIFRNFFGTVGEATGPLQAVDIRLDAPDLPANTSTSGCEASDFDDFIAGSVALIQRGTCNFSDKVLNAQNAGAVAVILFNEGQPGRDAIFGIGGDPTGITIPSVSASFAVGAELASTPGATMRVDVDFTSEVRTTQNIIADLAGRDGGDNVVMAGAHLDSVIEGPGINDNGSGSAAILALADQLGSNKKYTPQNTLRFAWWGAEEFGLVGSTFWVDNLVAEAPAELDKVAAYLNFDMVGSPNFIYGVYDADESSFPAPVPVPEGSIELEDLFEQYYSDNNIPYEDSEFSGRSDYQAFIENGIPSSGLFTGAEVVKTEEQQAIWGGIAGEAYDQCYHQACDTIDNPSTEALEVNVDAIAFSVFRLAASTELVNGVPGDRIPGPRPGAIDGPAGTVGTGGAGGLAVDHDSVVAATS